VLLENVAGAGVVETIANKILVNISKPVEFSSGPRSMGAAMGIALHPQHGETRDELMKNADQAMYEAKETGENCYRIWH
jgi:GGDEF domain-containing protein